MAIEGAKTPISEAALIYDAETKLAELATKIAQTRQVTLVQEDIKQATIIRLLLKALDYGTYLTLEERQSIWYALIEAAEIYNTPSDEALTRLGLDDTD